MSTRGQSAGAAEAAAVTRAERTTLDRDRQAAVRAGRIDAWRADLRSELIASLFGESVQYTLPAGGARFVFHKHQACERMQLG